MFGALKRNLAVAIVGVSVAAGGAAVWAQEGGGDPTLEQPPAAVRPQPPEGPGPEGEGPEGRRERIREGRPGHGHKGAHPFRHAVHGDLVVRTADGTFETVQLDKGEVTAVEGDQVTITRPDGPQVTVTVDDSTRFRGVEDQSQLRLGEPSIVVSKDGVARMIGQRPEGRDRPGPAPAGEPAAPAES